MHAFSGCSSLKSIEMANSVEKIGNNAFERCISLKSILIPNSVKEIGSEAFKGCASLENIAISNSVRELWNGVFENCISLKNIDIPDSVRRIGTFAFKGCISLECISLPDSEDYNIDDYVFCNCTSLKIIRSQAIKLDFNAISLNTFDGFDIDECTLYIPSGTRWTYRHHPGFGKFKNIEIEK